MIEKIEIQYFRSIYRTTLMKVEAINVLTGKNDVGKRKFCVLPGMILKRSL